MNKQYTCLQDGIIEYSKDREIVIRDWGFGVRESPVNREGLSPFVYVGREKLGVVICEMFEHEGMIAFRYDKDFMK